MITNAIDAHENKSYGRIDITTALSDNGQGVHMRISDCGCGITKENLEKIFDPFFTTKPVGRGTGLGLSICHSIIQGLGGHIEVKSKINEGTQFDIYLPLQAPGELIRT
jgi:two-component system NtrC family sensor kinase